MFAINRSAVLIKPTNQFVDWLNATRIPEYNEPIYTLEDVHQECTVLLVPAEEIEDIVFFIEQHYEAIFEHELASWIENPSVWPFDRTLDTFHKWFNIERHSLVFDLAKTEDELYDDEDEDEDDDPFNDEPPPSIN